MRPSRKNRGDYECLLFPRTNQSLWACGDLDLYIAVMSVFTSDGSFRSEKISQGIVFHVVHSGGGVMECNNVKYEVERDNLFVFWPNMHIKYYDFPDTPWTYTWFWLAGTKAPWVLSELGFYPDEPFYDISGCKRFHETLDNISRTFRRGEHSPFYPMLAAWEIVDALKDDMPEREKTPPLDNIASACRILIENDPVGFPSVRELAAHFNVERSTLFRLFKDAFKVSPKEYIERIRFEKACQLLSRTDMRVKEIANICGYDNQCYFSAAFQKRSGYSPSDWRKTNRKSNG